MNKAFSKRRFFLLIALALLILIYIVQLWLSSRTGVKIIRTEGEVSKIIITKGTDTENEVRLEKDVEGNWTVGSKKYSADENTVSSIVSALKEIKTLGTVASLTGDGSRYGLDDSSKITVTAFEGEKPLLTAAIGKNTSTGNQSYIQLDGKNTVLLASKAMHTIFEVGEDSLRSKKVFALPSAEVSSVTAKGQEGTFTVKKEKSQPSTDEENSPLPAVWILEKADGYDGEKISSEKVSAWVNSLCRVNVSSWKEEGLEGGEDSVLSEVKISSGGKDYTLSLISEEKISETETRYLCKSNQTPYLFYLSAYTAENVKKQLKDLAD